MITLAKLFSAISAINENDPELASRILNLPLEKRSLHLDLKDDKIVVNNYTDYNQDPVMAVSTSGAIEYLMCTRFIQ